MRNRLELHFGDVTKEQVTKCLDELRTLSPVQFTHEDFSPDMRDVLTKPEYLTVKRSVRLTFADEAACHRFMSTPGMRAAYLKYANDENQR